MLYCMTCRTVVEAGSALCKACGNGFTSRLACATCNKVVPAGQAFCWNCSRSSSESAPSEHFPASQPNAAPSGGLVLRRQPEGHQDVVGLALPKLPPGISLDRVSVPESRTGGKFGAISEIQMSGRDAEILTKINQVVIFLHALASEMTQFVALSDATRKNIKACRNLAADLQEEVEMRTGPAR